MRRSKILKNARLAVRRTARRLTHRLRRDQSGAVAVEFGFVALPFFGLVFAILQLALVFISDQLLETAVADAARMIRTGQGAQLGWTVTTFNAQVCNELYVLLDCTKLNSYIQTVASFSAVSLSPPVDPSTGNFNKSPSYDPAANTASQIVVVSSYYEYPTIFSVMNISLADQPNGTRLLGAVAAFRNEPFP